MLTRIEEALSEIPVPPQIERRVYALAFDNEVFDLERHDRDLESGLDICYSDYFRNEEAYDTFHRSLLTQGMLYSNAFFISNNILKILDDYREFPYQLMCDDLDGSEHSWAETHPDEIKLRTQEFTMIAFLKWHTVRLFESTLSTEEPIICSASSYITRFNQYNARSLEEMRTGLERYRQLVNMIGNCNVVPEELEYEIADTFWDATDKMSFMGYGGD